MSQKNNQQDASCIAKNGWRQGSVLPDHILYSDNAIKNALENINHTDKMIGVVISQDCDVVHPYFDTEPLVEILLGKIIGEESFKYECMGCQSPRKLHMRIAPSNSKMTETCVEFNINDRI